MALLSIEIQDDKEKAVAEALDGKTDSIESTLCRLLYLTDSFRARKDVSKMKAFMYTFVDEGYRHTLIVIADSEEQAEKKIEDAGYDLLGTKPSVVANYHYGIWAYEEPAM